MSNPTMTDRLWQVVEPYLAAEQVELDDLDLRGAGKGRMLRIVVDADGGVGVDRLAELSQGLSRLLDDEEGLQGSYTLEVTSPGLERNLTRPRHFQKSVGRRVNITTATPVAGATSHEGTLQAADEQSLTMDVGGDARVIDLDDVTKARTVFVWERGTKPGKRR